MPNSLDILATVIAAFIITALIITIQTKGWPNWTGFGKGESISINTVTKQDADGKPIETRTTTFESGKTLWDWLGLLGVPISLAILGYFFQQQQQRRTESLSREQRERDEAMSKAQREIADNEIKEEILQIYFDRLSSLLVDKNILAIATKESLLENHQGGSSTQSQLTSDEKQLLSVVACIIQARTLSILRRLEKDGEKKSSIIHFLIDTEIIGKIKLDLSWAVLREVNLIGAKLSRVTLIGADLMGSTLIKTDLSEADLRGVMLIGANLKESTLREANLYRANLVGTNLRGADLRGADLSKCEFAGANFSAANLSGANLSGANFRRVSVKWVDEVILAEADFNGADFKDITWDAMTEWPKAEVVAKAINIGRIQRLGE